jgi:hypothetical protein
MGNGEGVGIVDEKFVPFEIFPYKSSTFSTVFLTCVQLIVP